MTTSIETKALIRHLHHSQELTITAISKELGLHHSTIKRALGCNVDHQPPSLVEKFPPILAGYKGRLEELLLRYGSKKVPATRFLAILQNHGYRGSINSLRRGIALIKETQGDGPQKRAFSKRKVFAGHEAQMDWGSLGKIRFAEFEAKAYLFVLVLSWSRDIYAQVTLDMKFDTFARAHVRGFAHFGGVPKFILYDNLKTVVTKTVHDQVTYNHAALNFAADYKFMLRNCNVRQPQEKGRVERAVSYIKTSFIPARDFLCLDDCNEQLMTWLIDTSRKRQWPDDKRFIVKDRRITEQKHLQSLPAKLFYPQGETSCRVAKTPHIHFQRCQYSVPPQYVGKLLHVRYDDNDLEIYYGIELIALHNRCRVPGKVIEASEHILALASMQKGGSSATLRNALFRMVPQSEIFYQRLLERQQSVRGVVKRLYALLEKYGANATNEALETVLKLGGLDLDAVEASLRQRQAVRNQIPIHMLPPAARNSITKHQPLQDYEEIK